MSIRVNVCSDIVSIIKSFGYKGELAYNHLLYPTAVESRKLLMWLIDNVPKKPMPSSNNGIVETQIYDQISKELKKTLTESWNPLFTSSQKRFSNKCFYFSTSPLIYPAKSRRLDTTPGLEDYYKKELPFLTQQPKFRLEIGPSVFEQNTNLIAEEKQRELEWNSKGLESGLNPQAYKKRKLDNISKMMNGIMKTTIASIQTENISNVDLEQFNRGILQEFGSAWVEDSNVDVNASANLTEEEIAKKREEEIELLQKELSTLQAEQEEIEKAMQAMKNSMTQIEALINEEDLKSEKLEKEYKIKKKQLMDYFQMLQKTF